jgi:uncharacterized delta-60 repeat protein
MKYLVPLFAFLCIVSYCQAQIDNLDPNFGNGGVAHANFFSSWDEGQAAIRYPDGKILIAGRTRNAQNQYIICVARFLSNGQPDNNFGNQGKATFSSNANDNIVKIIDPLLQPDGKIIIPGTINVNNVVKRILVRIQANGQLDNSFAANGFYVSTFENEEDISQCRLFSDGRIWCIGGNQVSTAPNGLLRNRLSSIRFLANGIIDTSYNGSNYKVHAVATGEAFDVATEGCFLSDSTAVIVGNNFPTVNGTRRLVFAKINFKGNFDSTFGTNGSFRHLPPYNLFGTTRLKPASNGDLIMTAAARLSGSGQIGNTAVYRYKSIGRVDSSFGTNGIAVNPYYTFNGNYLAADFQVDALGKIWVAHFGRNTAGLQTYAVSVFMPNGAMDNSYNGLGFLMSGMVGSPKRIFLEPDGFPILAGTGIKSGITTEDDLIAVKIRPSTVSILPNEGGKFSVFPTLVESGTTIRIEFEAKSQVEWQLVNNAGQIIQKGISQQVSQIEPETSGLVPGMYHVRYLVGNTLKQARFVVY